MSKQEIVMDRAFDAACLIVSGDEEWGNEILARLKKENPENIKYIEGLMTLYTNMVSNNKTFLSRADYMHEHKGKLRLKF